MPYISADQLSESFKYLKDLNTFLVSLLAMFKAAVPTTDTSDRAVAFGAQNENALLREYFTVPGLPPTAPFFTAFGREQGGRNDTQYAGRTLQRLRTDAFNGGGIFWHPDQKRWAFKPGYPQVLAGSTRFRLQSVSISALAVWFYRKREIASVAQAVETFIEEFKLDRDGLIAFSFERNTERFSDADLRTIPLDDVEIAEILGISPPAAAPPPRSEFHEAMRKAFAAERIEIDNDLLDALIIAWLAREIVVLVGSPGTGKSTIALAVPSALESAIGQDGSVARVSVQVTSETDVSTMMGYQNLDGGFVPSEFTETLLLDQENQLKACVVILDEFNLASVDSYLAPVLAAIENHQSIQLSSGSGDGRYTALVRPLPVDTFIVGTCNSFVEEPETRQPLSRPVKRRCTILNVPNLLARRAMAEGVSKAFSGIGTDQIQRELKAVVERADVGSATAFDRYRREVLESCPTYDHLADDVKGVLEAVGEALLKESSARRFFTIGVFRDVLIAVVMSPPDQRIAAISQQFVSKLVHIYSGSPEGLRAAAEPLRGRPGYEAVDDMLREVFEKAEAAGFVPPLI